MLRIALAGVDAAALVREVTQAAFAEYRGTLVPPSGAFAETEADVAAAIAAGGAVLAWDGSTPVAAARFRLHPDHLYVGRLAVVPAHRRRGAGAAVMEYLEAHGRQLGHREARVEVRRALPDNVAFFAGRGYAIVAEQPHPLNPSARTVTLAKRL